jgi:hypothetical protein
MSNVADGVALGIALLGALVLWAEWAQSHRRPGRTPRLRPAGRAVARTPAGVIPWPTVDALALPDGLLVLDGTFLADDSILAALAPDDREHHASGRSLTAGA